MEEDRSKFYVGNVLYTIVELGDSEYVFHNDHDGFSRAGAYDPFRATIYLHKEQTKAQKRKTLIHEVSHAFIFEYGWYNAEDVFNEEQFCNFIACHAEEILRIVDWYMRDVG